MKINKHNLAVIPHCGTTKFGRKTDAVKITGNSTRATNSEYLLSVSALEAQELAKPVYADPLMLGLFDGEIDPTMLPVFDEGQDWPDERLFEKKPVQFEVFISAGNMLKLAQAMVDFAGADPDRAVRIRFSSQDDPMRIDVKQPETAQVMTAFVMGCKPEVHRKAFVGV